MTLHLDISQLVLDPRRSGIQRAERELIRHWPGPRPLKPCRFDPVSGGMVALPQAVFEVLCADAPAGGVAAELALLEPLLAGGRPVQPERLLNAELFLDPARAAFYQRCQASCRPFWLVYDFLPWLYPEWFSIGSPVRMMHFLRALRAVDDVAFISAQTRADYVERVVRRPGPGLGPVIPMGGDGLGLERQTFDAGRRSFVMLGTVEPRKNVAVGMRAFRRLWAAGHDADLVVIGAVSPDAAEELALLRALAGEARFTHLPGLPDEGVRQVLRRARAMVFPSEGEGYGIPPMEALHAGIPVIVSAGLPALSGLPGLGQIRLDVVSEATVAAAVAGLLDDTAAAALWADAGRMQVPGWAEFAEAVAEWVEGTSGV